MAKRKSKRSSRQSTIFTTMAIVIILVVVALYFTYPPFAKFCNDIYYKIANHQVVPPTNDDGDDPYGDNIQHYAEIENIVSTTDMSIHFLELGNAYTGDCTYIKAGEVDILIDAGSRKNSASTIISYVDNYCTDGTLEYVIVTHAHQDHIAAFCSSSSDEGIFEHYECETIIEFSNTNSDSALYEEYQEERSLEVDAGATLKSPLDYCSKEQGTTEVINLTDEIKMYILYQEFYEIDTSNENDYSVCALITHGEHNFLFTGDLEEEGEKSLIKYNDLPTVDLYKGGHHGSYTAACSEFLEVIQPDMVCVCCCAGSDEYTKVEANMFPAQAFIDRVSEYTDAVYCTTLATEDANKYTSFNGNICVGSSDSEILIGCSNNNTLLKDTDWFIANRTMPEKWKKKESA